MNVLTELLPVVDDKNQSQNLSLPRQEVHQKQLWHPVTAVWLIKESQILCSKRGDDVEISPDLWESMFGGHIKIGQSPEKNAVEEIHEESGIEIAEKDLVLLRVVKYISSNIEYGEEKRFIYMFYVNWKGETKNLITNSEVSEMMLLSFDEVKKAYSSMRRGWRHLGYELGAIEEIESRL